MPNSSPSVSANHQIVSPSGLSADASVPLGRSVTCRWVSVSRSQAYCSTTPLTSEAYRLRCGASSAQSGRLTRAARKRACQRAVTSGERAVGSELTGSSSPGPSPAPGRVLEPAGGLRGRVADVADEPLQHVLQRDQAEGALILHHPAQVRAGVPHRRQHVGQGRAGPQRDEADDVLVGDRQVARRGVHPEHVLDVHVAEQRAVVVPDRVAAETVHGDDRLQLPGRRRAGNGDSRSRGSSTESSSSRSKVSAPAASSPTSLPSRPSRRDWLIIERISASSKPAATSSVGWTPVSRTSALAMALNSRMTGPSSRTRSASGGRSTRGGREWKSVVLGKSVKRGGRRVI